MEKCFFPGFLFAERSDWWWNTDAEASNLEIRFYEVQSQKGKWILMIQQEILISVKEHMPAVCQGRL